MPTPGVGQDIEALCGKCGTVWHVVMAKMGDRIAKVVCKRCGGHHRYRLEGGAEAVREATRASGSTGRAARSRAAAAEAAPRALPAFDPDQPPRAYTPAVTYTLGDRVRHASFGVGVVAGSPGAGKVEVIFPTGPRVLACAKTASTLSRPVTIAAAKLPIADRPPK
jgi:hypothetical protein